MRLTDRIQYGALALPLALIGLPLYVYLPTLFAQTTGLSLATIGTILLASRLIEAFLDPLLGRWVARLQQGKTQTLTGLSWIIAIVMCLSLLLILASPTWLRADWHPFARASMLCGLVLLAYVAYGWLSIVHYSLGAQWVASGEPAPRLYGVREGLALVGVLLGSLLPLGVSWLMYGVICAGLVLIGMWRLKASWFVVKNSQVEINNATDFKINGNSHQLATIDPFIKRVLIVFFISTLAGSLPASLLGFYVADVLGLGDSAPQFLAIYFTTGALGFAVWPRLAAKYSAARLWSIAMLCAAVAFAFALVLRSDTPHVALWYGAVCGATGLLLGAEWMLPQTIVATRLASSGQSQQAGRIFGLWTWAQKMALAIATGVALWGLALLGYRPSEASSNTGALVVLYCLIPALMKAGAAVLAWHFLKEQQ